MGSPTFRIAMYPWFALGHLTPFLHLSNKLAKKGHKISFIIPTKTQPQLQPFNLHPDLITFIPITVPHINGLPPGAETTSDVPFPLHTLIMTAMDQTENDIELLLRDLKIDVMFFDFAHWMPSLARRLGIKSVHYSIITPVTVGYALSPARQLQGKKLTEAELMHPPPGFPESSVRFHVHEARDFVFRTNMKFGSDINFYDRMFIALTECDAFGYSTCRELEGQFCDYLESQFRKPVLLSGPAIPKPPTSTLEEKWVKWLSRFEAGSVIYCAFGSECTLKKEQFEDLVLGFELTGMPFMAALKPPVGTESIDSAMPQGLSERVEGRGIVYGGWVQQQLILGHSSVGCFVTHCGWASLSEALVNKCQLVLLPQAGDQIIHARIMSKSLKVGVEVEKGEEDGYFTRESMCKAVMTVMEEDSEVGKEVRANHDKIREFLLSKDLESSYLNSFNEKLQNILLASNETNQLPWRTYNEISKVKYINKIGNGQTNF